MATIWPLMYNGYVGGTTSSTAIYEGWIVTGTATTNCTGGTTWNCWVDEYTEISKLERYQNQVNAYVSDNSQNALARQHSAAQLEIRRMQEVQAAQTHMTRVRRAQAIQRRAERKALVILLRNLIEEQRKEFREHNYFTVTGGATGQKYRIRKGRVGNIDVLNKGGAVKHRLCAHPQGDMPNYDVMLAQALHLQEPANEELFVRTANVHALA